MSCSALTAIFIIIFSADLVFELSEKQEKDTAFNVLMDIAIAVVRVKVIRGTRYRRSNAACELE